MGDNTYDLSHKGIITYLSAFCDEKQASESSLQNTCRLALCNQAGKGDLIRMYNHRLPVKPCEP